MKCMRCNRDRELGVNLYGHFFCTECSSETIDSLAASGFASYVDNSVDVENFSVDDSSKLNTVTVVGPLPGEDGEEDSIKECPYTGNECHADADRKCTVCLDESDDDSNDVQA